MEVHIILLEIVNIKSFKGIILEQRTAAQAIRLFFVPISTQDPTGPELYSFKIFMYV